MDQLPKLALIEVFNGLSLYDQIKICSVCKQWKEIIEEKLSSRQELVLFFTKSPIRPLVWFHSDRPVNLASSLFVNDQFKKSKKFWQLFHKTQRLCVVGRLENLIFNKNSLLFANAFRQLKHFQVETVGYQYSSRFKKTKIRFKLPYLVSFCFKTPNETTLNRLNCPKLEMLSTPCHFYLDEKCAAFSDSLKLLSVASFRGKPGFELPNLEVLLCQNVLPIDFASHKKLKEIHYIYPNNYGNGYSRVHLHVGFPRPIASEVLDGMARERQALNRGDLQFYHDSVRYAFGSNETSLNFSIAKASEFSKSDLRLFLRNNKDLVVEHQRKGLRYTGELDEELAAMNAEQSERLAKCLVTVILDGALSEERALNRKFKILFVYVQFLHISADLRSQNDLDRLPDLFPHLVQLKQTGLDAYFAISNPTAYADHFVIRPLNFDFLAKFKGLLIMEIESWKISSNELKQIVNNCQYLVIIYYFSKKLEQLENKEIRTELTKIYIQNFNNFIEKTENKLFVRYFRVEYQFTANGRVQQENYLPEDTFDSSERMVDSLNQGGYLRIST